MKSILSLAAAALAGTTFATGAGERSAAGPNAGDTVVARWLDNKPAVFVMHFDDGCHSHLTNAVPALAARGIVGTFFICPGWPSYPKDEAAWKEAATKYGMEIGDHTMSHRGAPDAATFEKDVADCADYIRATLPPSAGSPLIAYGKPGTAPKDWKISEAEHQAAIDKAHCVQRLPHNNQVVGMFVKDIAAVKPIVQKALDTGGEGLLVFHGVGGDWLQVEMPLFNEILDLLASHKEQFWFAGAIAEHKYKTEREGSAVAAAVTPESITITLTSKADPALYDQELTILTRLPAGWTDCTVTQEGHSATVKAVDGSLQYRALPNHGPITITRRAAQ